MIRWVNTAGAQCNNTHAQDGQRPQVWPSKHKTFVQLSHNVGPTSSIESNIVLMLCKCVYCRRQILVPHCKRKHILYVIDVVSMALLFYFIKWLLWTVETMYFDVVEPVFYAARRKSSVLVRPNCANEQKRDNRFMFIWWWRLRKWKTCTQFGLMLAHRMRSRHNNNPTYCERLVLRGGDLR